jgi:hypothetical protein
VAAAVVVGLVMAVPTTAGALTARKPTAAQMQAWANKAQRVTTEWEPGLATAALTRVPSEHLNETPAEAVHNLDLAYGSLYFDQIVAKGIPGGNNADLGQPILGWLDAVGGTLTHSPDARLNKLTKRAITSLRNNVANPDATTDVSDLWSQVEATWRRYGMDSHIVGPWALSTGGTGVAPNVTSPPASPSGFGIDHDQLPQPYRSLYHGKNGEQLRQMTTPAGATFWIDTANHVVIGPHDVIDPLLQSASYAGWSSFSP